MALTAEQQGQLEVQLALENARHTNQMALEQLRITANAENNKAQADAQAAAAAISAKQIKLEAVRLAKETLIENRRNQPVDAREVTAADIAAYATTLVNYVNN